MGGTYIWNNGNQMKIQLPHYYFGNRFDHKSQQIKLRWEH